MKIIKISTKAPAIPIIRQTQGCKGIIGDYRFVINENIKEADWWVVLDGMLKPESIVCPPQNTILVAQETEIVRDYQPKFVKQFNWVLTSHRTMKHPHKITSHQGHNSYLFMSRKSPNQTLEEYQNQFKTYDELDFMKKIPKSKLLTAIVSHKQRSPGAIARHSFIMKLKEHFGDKFDIYSNLPEAFGPETKVSKFKWDAVAPYKYVLSIENSYAPHWWTQHLFDAFIGGAYPFFYGHPTIFEYLPKNCLTMIDINDLAGTIGIMEKAMSENYFEKYQKEIWEARHLVLRKYNIFQVLVDLITKLPESHDKKLTTLSPEINPVFELKQKMMWKIKKVPILRDVAKKIYRTYRTARYGENFDNRK